MTQIRVEEDNLVEFSKELLVNPQIFRVYKYVPDGISRLCRDLLTDKYRQKIILGVGDVIVKYELS